MSNEEIVRRLEEINTILQMEPDDYIKFYEGRFGDTLERRYVCASMVGMTLHKVGILLDDIKDRKEGIG